MRNLIIFILCAAIVSISASYVISADMPKSQCKLMSADSQSEPSQKPGLDYIALSFIGDCMLASFKGESGFNTFNRLADVVPPEYFFENVANIFAEDDYTIANCENVFTDTAMCEIVKDYEPAYWYKSKTANAEIFKKGNIDIVSLDNNHIMDYGTDGKLDTIKALEAAGVEWGDSGRTLVLEKKGIKIALYCTVVTTGGYITHILEWLDSVKDWTDYQIVYYHGGIELVHATEDIRINACHKLADAGADLIIGHHPHVIQPIENYNGVTIVYSLGNFLFGGGLPENRTIILKHYIYISNGKIILSEDEYIPCYCYDNDYQPTVIKPDSENNIKVIKKINDFLKGKVDSPL